MSCKDPKSVPGTAEPGAVPESTNTGEVSRFSFNPFVRSWAGHWPEPEQPAAARNIDDLFRALAWRNDVPKMVIDNTPEATAATSSGPYWATFITDEVAWTKASGTLLINTSAFAWEVLKTNVPGVSVGDSQATFEAAADSAGLSTAYSLVSALDESVSLQLTANQLETYRIEATGYYSTQSAGGTSIAYTPVTVYQWQSDRYVYTWGNAPLTGYPFPPYFVVKHIDYWRSSQINAAPVSSITNQLHMFAIFS